MEADTEKLVAEYQSVVTTIVEACQRRFPWRGSFDKSDLISVGFLTLLKCRKNYNPARGEFDSYARFSIRVAILGEMIRGITIRMPRHAYRRVKRTNSDSYRRRYHFPEGSSGFGRIEGLEENSAIEDTVSVMDLILSLEEKERYVVRHSFGIEYYVILDDQEIAGRLEISQKDVTRIRMLALAKMRELIGGSDGKD